MTLVHHPLLPAAELRDGVDKRVFAVQRLGTVLVATALLVFGLLVSTTGVLFLATHGSPVLGLSSNGLLSVLSLVVAVILFWAAVRGPWIASTVMIVLGVLFSIVVGLLLLLLGSYGRVSGHLPETSPYAHPHPEAVEPPDLPQTPAEFAAEAAMREAEIAVVEHHATEEQRRRVEAMATAHTRAYRRRIWQSFDR